MPETLQVEDLTFEVRRSAERSTVGLTVDRDGSLVAHAPDDCPTETLESIARRKQVWVHQKLAEKEFLNQSNIEKEYVPGEGFYYLGKTYRLRLVEDPDRPPLQLLKGRFCLREDERPRAREHFKRWYLEHAQPWLKERVGRFVDRMAVDLETIAVRDIGYRWGSCNDARVHFHWRVILLDRMRAR